MVLLNDYLLYNLREGGWVLALAVCLSRIDMENEKAVTFSARLVMSVCGI